MTPLLCIFPIFEKQYQIRLEHRSWKRGKMVMEFAEAFLEWSSQEFWCHGKESKTLVDKDLALSEVKVDPLMTFFFPFINSCVGNQYSSVLSTFKDLMGWFYQQKIGWFLCPFWCILHVFTGFAPFSCYKSFIHKMIARKFWR